jgi:membrane-associated protease RseP (regulator of RpoE activity)
VPLEPGPAEDAGRRTGRPGRGPLPPWAGLLFFLATLYSTTVAGAALAQNAPWTFTLLGSLALKPAAWLDGLPYAAAVLFILGVHEMGHYVACRLYRIDASPPFFLPGPNPFGTFGAVIRIRAPFTDRRALFDVGVAGPIAGFIAALPILIYGLWHSDVTNAPPGEGILVLPSCLLTRLMYPLFLPAGGDVVFHPLFVAAWLGLFATALNLLPIGQLDGGHILYALSPRAHRLISLAGIPTLCLIGYRWEGYHLIVFAILFAIIGIRHPRPIDDVTPLGAARLVVALIGLLVFLLCFMPEGPGIR